MFQTGGFLLLFGLFFSVYLIGYKQLAVRKWLVLLFSLYFYIMASGSYVLLLLLTIFMDYAIGVAIQNAGAKTVKAKTWLVTSIVLNVGILAYFKYTDFGIEIWNALTAGQLSPLHVFLPIGISFFTFQSISYKVDVYQGKLAATRSLLDYAFYITFFPHLVAGPIVRAKDFLYQINGPLMLESGFIANGLWLILKGYVKKAVFADYLAQYADLVYANPNGFSGLEHIMAMYAYTMQIFCDFSGYTDMAIGIAAVMGFKLCENFDSPYQSLSITEFWRRWHISLSTWLRDYIYIPLGGNRKGPWMQQANQLLTMLIGGLWHGAALRFVIWGGVHGLALAIHKLWLRTPFARDLQAAEDDQDKDTLDWIGVSLMGGLSWLLTFHLVAFLWILFRVPTMEGILLTFEKIFAPDDWYSFIGPFYQARPLVVWMLILSLAATLAPKAWKQVVQTGFERSPLAFKGMVFVIAIQIALQLAGEGVQPFIYFQF